MRGSAVFRALAAVVGVLLLAGLGVGIYQAGVAQGLAEAGRAPMGTVVPYYGYGFHPWGLGFGLFGFVWFVLVVLLLVSLVRFAFGGRGGWGGSGRGGWGPGGGWDPRGFAGGPGDERRRRLEELHRELHEEADRADASSERG